MSFIKGKPVTEVHLCTKAGNSPYNKGGTTQLVETKKIISVFAYKGASLVVLRPIIDKLVFGYDFKDQKHHVFEIKKAFVQNLEKMAEGLSFVTAASSRNVGASRYYELYKYYHHNFLFTHPGSKGKIIIQLEPKYKGPFVKCELNPARLGPGGMKFFRDTLQAVTFNEWSEFSLERLGSEPHGVKRLDVAVDMLGVDASDIEGTYVDKGKTPKKYVFQNSSGRVESSYFLLPNHDKNEAYWYNKRTETAKSKNEPLEGKTPSPYGHALHTRFEYRIYDTTKPLFKMKSLTNHLLKFKLQTYDYKRLTVKSFGHVLFLKYAMMRTGEKALELVPSEKKAVYQKSLDQTRLAFWEPEKIWEKGWIEELAYLGLLPSAKKKENPKSKK